MTPGSAVATTGSSGPLRYRVRDDPQRAKEVANDYKSAVMAGVMENLPPGVIWSVRWSKSVYPSVDNPEVYAGLPVGGLEKILDPEIRRLMFLDDAAATLLERSDGVWPAIERDDAPPHNTAGRKSYSKGAGAPYPPGSAAPSIPRTSLFSASELLQLFEEQVMPAQIQASSRSAYWTGWKQVLTFGLAHGELDKLLPMTVATLKSLTAEFLLVGVTANSIKNLWSAIEHRHRLAHLPSPLAQRMAFKRTFKAVCAVRGAPSRLLFPIGTHHLARMLALVDLSPAQQRSVLIVAVGTASCCRVAEVGNFQMCDLLWDLDATFHRDLTGGLAIRVWKRKQDTGRFGLYPRIPPGQLVARLRKFVQDLDLRVSIQCTKERSPGGRCPFCDPVFPHAMVSAASTAGGRLGGGPVGRRALVAASRQQISDAVGRALGLIGVDAERFSGISMRRGGITAAVQARVPESILYLQSGHGTARAGRRYVDPVDPRVLYETGRAILAEVPGSPAI